MTREELQAKSDAELDAIALSWVTLSCQVRLSDAQYRQVVQVCYEFNRRGRLKDYEQLGREARAAWREGREPTTTPTTNEVTK